MPTAAVTHTLVNGDPNDASEVNTNFSDLVSFINTNAIQKDASVAFTAVPTGPASDPSSDNQLARKAYVDNRTLGVLGSVSSTTVGSEFSTSFAATGLSFTFTMPTLASPRAVRLQGCVHVSSAASVSSIAAFTVQFRLGTSTVLAEYEFTYATGFVDSTHSFSTLLLNNSVVAAGSATINLYAKQDAADSDTALAGSTDKRHLLYAEHI